MCLVVFGVMVSAVPSTAGTASFYNESACLGGDKKMKASTKIIATESGSRTYVNTGSMALVYLQNCAENATRYGNWIFAMGGDEVSARNAGIPTNRLRIALFVLSSTAAAFVGMCGAILFNSAQVSGGMNYIFNTIVSIVVGGVLLTGGFGSVAGIFLGALTFAVVNQGIYFTDIDRNWSNLIIGVMLMAAVLMNDTFRQMALSFVSKKNK